MGTVLPIGTTVTNCAVLAMGGAMGVTTGVTTGVISPSLGVAPGDERREIPWEIPWLGGGSARERGGAAARPCFLLHGQALQQGHSHAQRKMEKASAIKAPKLEPAITPTFGSQHLDSDDAMQTRPDPTVAAQHCVSFRKTPQLPI